MPNDKSAFVTNKLIGGKDFNYNSPVWVKLNVNNDIDEADLIVMGDAVLPPPTPVPTPSPSMFASFINAKYDNGKLVYTGGEFDLFGVTLTHDAMSQGVAFLPSNPFIFMVGGTGNPSDYLDGDADGTLVHAPNGVLTAKWNDIGEIPYADCAVDVNDVLRIALVDSQNFSIDNMTTKNGVQLPIGGSPRTQTVFTLLFEGTKDVIIHSVLANPL